MSSGYSVDTRNAPFAPVAERERSSTESTGELGGHGQDHPDRVGRGLRVLEGAERGDRAPPLLDPVASGDPDVEQAVGDVERDLLRSQDADVVDARVVDGRPVVDARRTADREIGVCEELEGGLLEGALGEDQTEHAQRPPTE